MVRKVGRPSGKSDSRERLIFHARKLFTELPYEKVSTRMVAAHAQVNIAMIRYYFANKEGLFETMIRETMEPVLLQLQWLSQKGGQGSFAEVMQTYYETMVQTPDFPKLLVHIMSMSPSDMQRRLLESIFDEVAKPMDNLLSEKMRSDNMIREDMDPKFCRISFMSLMIFPFLAPGSLYSIHGIELNNSFLNQLLEHNMKVLTHGFLMAENYSGDSNEN